MRLYALLFGFLGGVSVTSLFSTGSATALFLAVVAGALYVYGYVEGKSIFSALIIISFGLAGCALGIVRFQFSAFSGVSSTIVDQFVDQRTSIEGVVVREPEPRDSYTRLIVSLRSINGKEIRSAPHLLVFASHFPEFSYGDLVQIQGTFQYPQDFETDTGRRFEYVSYLKKDNVGFQMFYPDIVLLESGLGNPIRSFLISVKKHFMGNVAAVIPEPQSALGGGLLLGERRSLGEVLLEDFRAAGLIHIVVLSGYNLTIIAESIIALFGYMARRSLALVGGSIAIVLFAIMTGGSATVVRASLMALLALLARGLGRPYSLGHALLLAGVFMVAHNPAILIFDPSFQLSFMATFSLVWLAPIIEKHLTLIPVTGHLREIATATLATQIFVLPLLLWMTGQLSLIAPLANLAALIVIPAAMFFVFLTGAFGFLSTVLSIPFAFVAHILLSYVIFVAERASALPFASVTIAAFPFSLLLVWYGAYAIFAFSYRKKSPPKG